MCPLKECCYKEGDKSKTYSITIKSTEHEEQAGFQETEEFKDLHHQLCAQKQENFIEQAVKDGIIQESHLKGLQNGVMTTDRLVGLYITI